MTLELWNRPKENPMQLPYAKHVLASFGLAACLILSFSPPTLAAEGTGSGAMCLQDKTRLDGVAAAWSQISGNARAARARGTSVKRTTVNRPGSVAARPVARRPAVNRNTNVNVRRTNVTVVGRPVRGWSARPHYGTIVAGVALGAVIGVAVANAAPTPPAANLCWYWSDSSRTQGYWDYC
jgi:hypothetical protein